MKRTYLVLTMGALLTCPLLAQSTDSTNAPPPGDDHHHHHMMMNFLTDAEKAELKKAHDAAVAADPSLATEDAANMAKMKAAHEAKQKPSQEDMEAMKAFREKMDAAMIKADPAVEPIIEKMKAHHSKDKGGPPPAQ